MALDPVPVPACSCPHSQQVWAVLAAGRGQGVEGLLGTGPGTSTAGFLQLPLPPGSPRSYSRNTSQFLCYSFTRSQSTFASLVGHLGLIRMTAEQSQPLTLGHPGVGSMPTSLCTAVLTLYPSHHLSGPYEPQSLFRECWR